MRISEACSLSTMPKLNCSGALQALCCVLICALCHTQSATPDLILQGRFFPGPGRSQRDTALPQLFSWPASSIYTGFAGSTSISINITASPQDGLTFGINWFRFFIDGQFAADGFTTYNQLNLLVTLNVTTAPHTLRIAKMNDGAKGAATLQGLTLANGSFFPTLAPPTVASGRRILFLGDSYSVGNANTAAVLPNTCVPNPQQLQPDWTGTCNALRLRSSSECADLWHSFDGNGLESYTAAAAEALGADFQVIATAGSGLVGYAQAAILYPNLTPAQYQAILPSTQALFRRTVYSDANSQYDLQSWMPQVVVVASGINDWHINPPMYTLDQWIAKSVAFLRQVSDTYNAPPMILLAFNSTSQGDESDFTTQYVKAMSGLYAEATKQGLGNVHYLGLQSANFSDFGSWCQGHPSVASDRAIAQQLVDLIDSIVPKWNSTTINLTVDQAAIRPNTDLYVTNPGGIVGPIQTLG